MMDKCTNIYSKIIINQQFAQFLIDLINYFIYLISPNYVHLIIAQIILISHANYEL